jgi:DNA-binding response OmpR family regulator
MASVDHRSLVIVVDDDAANLLLLTRIFAKRPHIEIVTEPNGSLAFDLILERKPDVVLLDLNLADSSGELILKQMRSHDETAATPVVMLSGDVSEVTKRRLIAAGAQHYLEKPYTISEVITLVESLLTPVRDSDGAT